MFDDDAAPGPMQAGPSFGLNFDGKMISQLLRAFLQPRDHTRELQEKLLEVQIARSLAGATVPYALIPWDQLPVDRDDYVVVGRRGAGKTGFACALAQRLGRPAFAVNWPEPAAEALGFRACSWEHACRQQDATVLLDEFALRQPPSQELFQLLALARHRNIATIYTTQTTSALTRDVLRMGPVVAWKAPDPLASQFEREELLPMAAAALLMHQGAANQAPAFTALNVHGQWCATLNPLPAGWTETTSTLWRT